MRLHAASFAWTLSVKKISNSDRDCGLVECDE
jgi:hypothetical protein